MILVIAEKPSLARNIVAGIGKMERKNGYFEGLGYIVTWAFGHLFSLCDIEDYSGAESGGKWTLENLPCFPNDFKFKLRREAGTKDVDDGVRRQFETIKSLCHRNDVDTIVNAGDSDREGEIIVRLCISNAEVTGKKLLRLWLPDQTPQTVAAALA
ncbi:MAG: type IA DNA topoisomerase, partial [Clostridiales bacterium]|nr:type IA DNA topoisomerase [Clostridiales bacterium]